MPIRWLKIIFTGIFLSAMIAGAALGESGPNKRAAAEDYLQRAMFDEAVVAYKAALAEEPDNPELRLGYARALAGNELLERALSEYERIAETVTSEDILRELADVYAQNGDYVRAIKFYQTILRSAPRNNKVRLFLAEAYLYEDTPGKAISEYETVIKTDPRDLDALIGAGQAYYQSRDYHRAERCLLKAKAIAPDDVRIARGLGNVYFSLGRYEAAIGQFSAARQRDDADRQIIFMLAQAYLRNDEDDNAVKTLEELLEKDPENDEARVLLGNVYLATGAYRKTVAVLAPVRQGGYLFIQQKLLMMFAYGALGDSTGFWQCLSRIKIIVVVLLILLIAAVALGAAGLGLLLFFAYSLGKLAKHPAQPDDARRPLTDVFIICMLIFLLPLFLGVIIGAAVYGNWFLIFTGTYHVSSPALQTALLAQIEALLIICVTVFLFVVKKYRQPLSGIGFIAVSPGTLIRLSLGAIAAVFLFSAGYLFLFSMLSGHSPQTQFIGKVVAGSGTFREKIPLFLFVVLVGPLGEEIIFRGFIFSSLRRYSGFGTAALISAVIFGMFHFQLSLFIPIAFMGYVFSFVFERTRSIIPSCIAHVAWNLLSFSAMLSG